ncbi:MAG TPA: DUF1553 domain-containing protein, partial [Pirellulaceae bacterium]|nr:DUF1553 domain-containing protein [Pirellulaceae bacterium]
AKLVEIALQSEQRHYFAKAIVNQLWNRLYGYGLVMPIDQMHPENPPSHPELMDWLARDLIEHQYDLKRLMRGMVLSNAYARSSRWEANERPAASLFAVANVRALTPPQYAAVLGLGSASASQFSGELKAEDFDNRLRSAIGPAQGVVEKLEHPGTNFQVSVDEALLLANSERVMRDVLRDKQPSLLHDLRSLPDRRPALEMAIWNTLNRPPVEEELQMLDSYLARRNDRVEVAWQQLVWALLTSTEARFNY